MKGKKLSQIKLKNSLELKENNMFIKFEYNKDNSVTINKEFIIGIECRNIEDKNNNIHELRRIPSSSPCTAGGFFLFLRCFLVGKPQI